MTGAAPTEANRETVTRAFEAWRAGTAPIVDLFAPDMTWEITGRSLVSRHYASRQEFADEVLVPFARRFPSDAPFGPSEIRAVLADGDTVTVVWHGRGVRIDGKPYENTYAWIMRLRDGRVVEGTAFLDSIAFDELWTEVAPAG